MADILDLVEDHLTSGNSIDDAVLDGMPFLLFLYRMGWHRGRTLSSYYGQLLMVRYVVSRSLETSTEPWSVAVAVAIIAIVIRWQRLLLMEWVRVSTIVVVPVVTCVVAVGTVAVCLWVWIHLTTDLLVKKNSLIIVVMVPLELEISNFEKRGCLVQNIEKALSSKDTIYNFLAQTSKKHFQAKTQYIIFSTKTRILSLWQDAFVTVTRWIGKYLTNFPAPR